MKHDLYATVRPGSTRARREKLKEALPVLEEALHNGWRWGDIVDLARELLGEPNLSVGAIKNIRYRYKRLLAKRPELAAPMPSPIPAVQAIAPAPASPPLAEPPGESSIARVRRLHQQEKAQMAAMQQQAQAPTPAPNAPAAALSLSGKQPRTVARKVEEIAQALEADSDMLKYPVMGAEEAMALAQDLKARNGLQRAMMEFAHYCVDRILPIYQEAHKPLIEMRTQFEQWKDALIDFARRRRPYRDILLLAVQQVSPFPDLDEYSGPFEQFTLTQVRSAIAERVRKEAESREKRESN